MIAVASLRPVFVPVDHEKLRVGIECLVAVKDILRDAGLNVDETQPRTTDAALYAAIIDYLDLCEREKS